MPNRFFVKQPDDVIDAKLRKKRPGDAYDRS
jgi:hypothetical protein